MAALIFSPACKAQSEVDPDHFDGTDSWQTAVTRQAPAPKRNQANAVVGNKKSASGASVQMAAERQSSQAVRPEAVALQEERKASKRKPNNQ